MRGGFPNSPPANGERGAGRAGGGWGEALSARPLPFLQRGDNGAVPARPGTGSGWWALFLWARGRGAARGWGQTAVASPHTPGVGESPSGRPVPYRRSERPEGGGEPTGPEAFRTRTAPRSAESRCCRRFWL